MNSEASTKSYNLIILDPYLVMHRIYFHYLETLGTVTCFISATKMFSYLQSHPADLIICEVDLHNDDFPTVCSEIAASSKGTPLMLITMRPEYEMHQLVEGCRYETLIHKPIEGKRLLNHVKALLDGEAYSL